MLPFSIDFPIAFGISDAPNAVVPVERVRLNLAVAVAHLSRRANDSDHLRITRPGDKRDVLAHDENWSKQPMTPAKTGNQRAKSGSNGLVAMVWWISQNDLSTTSGIW